MTVARTRLVAAGLALTAGVVCLASRTGRESEARAAYAEYLIATEAAVRSETADAARRLGPDGDGPAGETERVAAEATDHADRLRAEWGGR